MCLCVLISGGQTIATTLLRRCVTAPRSLSMASCWTTTTTASVRWKREYQTAGPSTSAPATMKSAMTFCYSPHVSLPSYLLIFQVLSSGFIFLVKRVLYSLWVGNWNILRFIFFSLWARLLTSTVQHYICRWKQSVNKSVKKFLQHVHVRTQFVGTVCFFVGMHAFPNAVFSRMLIVFLAGMLIG